MKITILSDIHMGYGPGERENDPFDVLDETIKKNLDSDVFLLPGDIFDKRNPKTETITRAMKILVNTLTTKSDVKITQGVNKDLSELSPMNHQGIPVVAISGTHERRARGLVNVIEAFEHAGFFIYLHCNGVVIEKDGEKVCIQGLSGVPEQFASSVLGEWNPKPVEGCVNILMIHQDLVEFMYTKSGIKLSQFPKGFDLYACGHIHGSQKQQLDKGQLLICGSPVTTQLKEEETQEKGYWTFDTKTKSIDFQPLENSRKVYIISDEKEIESILSKPHKKKPIIRLKTKNNPDVSKYEDKALIYIKKEIEKELPLKTLDEHKISVQDLGKKLLMENLKESGLDLETFENLILIID